MASKRTWSRVHVPKADRQLQVVEGEGEREGAGYNAEEGGAVAATLAGELVHTGPSKQRIGRTQLSRSRTACARTDQCSGRDRKRKSLSSCNTPWVLSDNLRAQRSQGSKAFSSAKRV
jgi:hypothetical protein